MSTFQWDLQGVSNTIIDVDDKLEFASGTFGSRIYLGQYNDSMHVRNSGDTDDSAGNSPVNVKYISTTEGDWGSGTQGVTNITQAESTLKINFSDASAVTTLNTQLYAYDGASTGTPPIGVDFKAFEQGSTVWVTPMTGSSVLSLADQGATTSHDFFIPVSASPTSTGVKDNFTIRLELNYV